MLLPQWNIWVPFKDTTPVTAFLHSELPQWELITHMDTHRFWHRAASVSMWERNPESIKKASVMREKVKDIQPRGKEKCYSVTTHQLNIFPAWLQQSLSVLLQPHTKIPLATKPVQLLHFVVMETKLFYPISISSVHLVSSETEHFRALYRQSNDAIQFPFHYTCASVPQFNMTI